MSTTHIDDPFNLVRFVNAQTQTYEAACGEIQRGRKTGHWMWFIFPQIAGLGASITAMEFAISGRKEANAYLSHELLGARIRECSRLVSDWNEHPIDKVFESPDNLKLRSSMTLFAKVTSDNKVFLDVLEKFYDGKFDQRTIRRLRSE